MKGDGCRNTLPAMATGGVQGKNPKSGDVGQFCVPNDDVPEISRALESLVL